MIIVGNTGKADYFMIDYHKIAAAADLAVVDGNYVGALQNAAVAEGAPVPEYHFVMSGEPHAPTFSAWVFVNPAERTAPGKGPNKKAAKQAAAKGWIDQWNQK